jgi:hypothetical protein
MTSFLTLLGYIVVAFSFAVSPTAARATALPEKEDSVVHHGTVSLATANSDSTSSSTNNNNDSENIKTQNELAVSDMLLSNHFGNDSNYPNQDSMNSRTDKLTTTHGQGTNTIHHGRHLQTSDGSGKGKKKNQDESTCALDVSTDVFSIRQLVF